MFILRLRETLCTRFYLFSVLPEIHTDKNPYYQESPFYIHLFGVFPCGLLALRNRVAPRPLLLSIVSRCRFTRHHLRPWGCVVSCFPHLATIPVPIYKKAFMFRALPPSVSVFLVALSLSVSKCQVLNGVFRLTRCKVTNNISNKSSYYKKSYFFNLFPYKNTYFNGTKWT